MSKNHGPNKKNLEETRKLFLKKAKAEFVKYGYADASTNRIVESSGMARGSLYYHFGDKKGLFTALYKNMLTDMGHTMAKSMQAQNTKWEALLAGIERYLELCLQKDKRRIILEAYNALNYEERMRAQRETLLGTMENLVTEVMKEGYFEGQKPEIMSTLIYGMITEVGRSFEIMPDPKKSFPAIRKAAREMLEKMASS